MRAALELGAAIDLAAVAAWVEERERNAVPDLTLLETAGGLYSPLAPGLTNVDLIRALAVDAWVLVARDRLGVLHDCLATLAAARAQGCSPVAVLLGARDADPPAGNLEDLVTCCGLPAYRDPGANELAELLAARTTG
jgi:dethiobiotin synthetase